MKKTMNKSVRKQPNQNIASGKPGRKPDIRDDLDSREHEEQQIKGSNITNNKKKKKGPDRSSK